MAGIGLDAHVVYHVNAALKARTGKFAYWVAGWSLLGRRLAEFDVEIAGKRRKCSFALFSKVRNYGGDFEIARSVTLIGRSVRSDPVRGPDGDPICEVFCRNGAESAGGHERRDGAAGGPRDDLVRRTTAAPTCRWMASSAAAARGVPHRAGRAHAAGARGVRSDAPAVVFDGLFDGVVLLGEAHQLQADGVYQGLPTGFDDVFADADGAPTAAVVAPFDQDADVGGGAFVGIEDADFVVGQADVGDLRVELAKGTCAGRRGGRRRGRGRSRWRCGCRPAP